jgi:hypothetical protein
MIEQDGDLRGAWILAPSVRLAGLAPFGKCRFGMFGRLVRLIFARDE